MGYYEKLSKVNIADAVQQLGMKMDYDGKVDIPYHLDLVTPWLEQGVDPNRDCMLWLNIFFEKFNVIHPGCMSCWKVFYRPKTVRELFKIYELQKTRYPDDIVPSCKCGIETRTYTGNHGGYGAFWYNPLGCGLEQARENCERLSEVFGAELQLKRGCTEMEQFTIRNFGKDSTQWSEFLEPSREKLSLLELTFHVDPMYKKKQRPLPVIIKTHAWWIRWAAEHGDQTYLDFTDGKMFPDLHMYKDSIDRGKDIDDGAIWKEYKSCGANKERIGGTDGKQEQTIIEQL